MTYMPLKSAYAFLLVGFGLIGSRSIPGTKSRLLIIESTTHCFVCLYHA